jgi:hypothetical protein
MRFAQIVTITIFAAAIAFPKEKVQLPQPAPLPDRVLQAKTICLTSDADKFVYDEAYRQIKEWGRFQLTTYPEEADLIWTMRTEYVPRGSGPNFRRAQSLMIFDPRTKLELWSEHEPQRFALKEKNREKASILAVDAIFQRLRDRIPAK